jgi:uncharacterized protein (DUF362 family)
MNDHAPAHRIDRRTFLRGAAAVGTFAAAAAVGWEVRRARTTEPWDPSAFPPPGPSRVAVLRARSYEVDLESVVLDGLRAVGADVSGARVLLKPNMVEYDPHGVVNTDHRVVLAAVHALRRLGAASVTVAEGPGHRRDTGYVVEATGLGPALREAHTPFVDLNVARSSSVPLQSRYTNLGAVWLPDPIREADIVISMPKMKTHHWAAATLSLKNCFGCLPGRVYGWPKNALHWAGIQPSILDIAGAVRPAYAIVDAIVGMEGNGPINGTAKHVGLLVVGDDPVAVDATSAYIMGMDPTHVSYIAEAGRFLGVADLDRIAVAGEDPATVVTPFAPAPGFGQTGSITGGQ